MSTLTTMPASGDRITHGYSALRAARRARLVFVSLYALAALALLWCAVPWPGSTGTGALLPLVVGVQVLGAMAMLTWLLGQPAHRQD